MSIGKLELKYLYIKEKLLSSFFEQLMLLVKVARPKQWTKNLIAYAPLLFAMKMHMAMPFLSTTLCVVALCMLSSTVYIVNDILDRDADRVHPVKCNRPLASGKLSVLLAVIAALALLCGGLFISFAIRPALILVMLAYLLISFSYGLLLKHYAIIDVFCIASGFVLRAVAGAVAAAVPVSGWFLLCTSFGALFLALEKRRQELNLLGDGATQHRKSLDLYANGVLDRMESVIVPSLITCYAFYSFLSQYGQWMMLTVPFVLYGIMRYQVLSTTKTLTSTPEEVLLKDRPIQVTILLWILVSAAVIYNFIPVLLRQIIAAVDSLSF
jgi:4-hydroxybenzoate polyprenyltransferase